VLRRRRPLRLRSRCRRTPKRGAGTYRRPGAHRAGSWPFPLVTAKGGQQVLRSVIAGCISASGAASPGSPPADPRDWLIRKQAERIGAQEWRLAVQAEQIAALEAVVADLRGQLEAAQRAASRNSGNFSMPPSTDDLPGRTPPRRQRRAAARAADSRKRGKQPGSPGASMTWQIPDRTQDHYPQGSCSCGRDLATRRTWASRDRSSSRRSRPRRPSGCSTTCTRPSAPAAGPIPRPARRACRIRPCRSGRGCGPWPSTWSSSSMCRRRQAADELTELGQELGEL